MERPKLRALESFAVQHEGQPMLLLRDPDGLSEHCAVLPPAAVAIVRLCDGQRTLEDVALAFRLRTGRAIEIDAVRRLVTELDRALLLDSPRWATHHHELLREFRKRPLRELFHAGGGYPRAPAALRRFLRGQALRSTGPGRPAKPRSSHDEVSALISPHIDFHRGGGAYAHGWRPVEQARARPDLVIVFGTDHHSNGQPFTLTSKSYGTPLGPVRTDAALVAKLAAALGPQLFDEELHHQREHSIEFQAVWLRHVYGDDCPPMLPVLCGSFHRFVESGGDPADDPAVAAFLDTLAELTSRRRTLIIAGADLAHVGPQFGDPRYGLAERTALRRADEAALAAAVRGDPAAFFRAIADVGDRHRVCGLSPIWATLRMLEGSGAAGQQVAYDQCAADEAQESFVSIASVVYR